MSRVLMSLLPGAVFLFPDNDFPVIGAGCQDIAIHWVGPGHLPHRTLMTAKGEGQRLLRWARGTLSALPAITLERTEWLPW